MRWLYQSVCRQWRSRALDKGINSLRCHSVPSLSHIWFFETSWTAALQASLSIISSLSLLKLISIELMMPSNHLILCRPLLLLPSIFPSIRVFSNKSVLPISSVQFTLSRVWLFATPWTTARQASLSITNSWSLPKPMSIESVMPSCRFILCHPLLILPPILPSIRVFSNELTLLMR